MHCKLGFLSTLTLVFIAGCSSGPTYTPLGPSTDPTPPQVVPSFDMSQCISSEALIALPEQEPTPPGVTPAPSSQLGPLQQYTFWGLTCTTPNETGSVTLLTGLMEVEVSAAYESEGDELFVVGVELDSPALLAWFAAVGLEFELGMPTHEHQPAGDATRFHLYTEGIAIDGVTLDGTPEPRVLRRLLFGAQDRVTGIVDVTTTEHGLGVGAATVTSLEGVPLALTGEATAGTVGQARLAWIPGAPNP